jgi:Flp pilus assembly protein CpaB
MPDPEPRPRRTPPPFVVLSRRLRRSLLVHRRSLAAGLAGVAVLTGLRAAAAPATPTVDVVVARHDLPGGSVVADGDLVTAGYRAGTAPAGAGTSPGDLTGRVLAAPVRQGEPVTDVRLVAPGLLNGYPGLVAAPVRVADAGAVALLRVGDRIELLAASPDGGDAAVVVAGAPVVALPSPASSDAGLAGGLSGGGLVVVAVTPGEALALAQAAVKAVLSVVLER